MTLTEITDCRELPKDLKGLSFPKRNEIEVVLRGLRASVFQIFELKKDQRGTITPLTPAGTTPANFPCQARAVGRFRKSKASPVAIKIETQRHRVHRENDNSVTLTEITDCRELPKDLKGLSFPKRNEIEVVLRGLRASVFQIFELKKDQRGTITPLTPAGTTPANFPCQARAVGRFRKSKASPVAIKIETQRHRVHRENDNSVTLTEITDCRELPKDLKGLSFPKRNEIEVVLRGLRASVFQIFELKKDQRGTITPLTPAGTTPANFPCQARAVGRFRKSKASPVAIKIETQRGTEVTEDVSFRHFVYPLSKRDEGIDTRRIL